MIKMKLKLTWEPFKIMRAVERSERKLLNNVGGYIRKTAQNSMKLGARGQRSREGEPPLSHTKRYKANVKYAYDGSTRSVVVGAESFDGNPTPGIIENGGPEYIRVGLFRKRVLAQFKRRPAMRLALEKAQEKFINEALKDYIAP